MSMAWVALHDDFAGGHVECGDQCCGVAGVRTEIEHILIDSIIVRAHQYSEAHPKKRPAGARTMD